MKKQKNKFLTFLLALIPGAAHMYIGFMRKGLSLMGVTCALAILATSLNYAEIAFAFPLIWFYSFFDAVNLNGLIAEEFDKQTDEPFYRYLFNDNAFRPVKGSYNVMIGVVVIVTGSLLLLVNIMPIFYDLFPRGLTDVIQSTLNRAPRFIVGMVILWLGIKLIRGKSRETVR